MSYDALLVARNLKKAYKRGGRKRISVLQDVSLSLERGVVTGLLGASGSGKSTLARLLLGLERPDAGEIVVDGQDLFAWRAANRGRMAVVFQDYVTSVNPAFTVEECIAEGFWARGSKQAPCGSNMTTLLDRAGLADSLRERRCLELSGGQIQRVCLARALAARPDILVLDEALSSLDVSLQAGMAELLRSETLDMACLFITHDIQLASRVCEKILVLDGGRITDDIATKALFKDRESLSPRLQQLLQSTIVFRSNFEDGEESGVADNQKART